MKTVPAIMTKMQSDWIGITRSALSNKLRDLISARLAAAPTPDGPDPGQLEGFRASVDTRSRLLGSVFKFILTDLLTTTV